MLFSMQPPEIYGEAMKQFSIQYYLSKTSDNATVTKVLTNFLNNDKNIEESNHLVSGINPFKTSHHASYRYSTICLTALAPSRFPKPST